LDRQSGWFSFANSNSRLRVALRKIFALTDRVLLRDLRAALSKQIELIATTPGDALETYLTAIAGCEIWDGWVLSRASDEVLSLGRDERTIMALVRDNGGEISIRSLQKQAKFGGLSAPAVLRFVRSSPLVLERGGRLRLVGAPRYSVKISSATVVSSVARVVSKTSTVAGSVADATQPIVGLAK
jgi:hypothetical protein